MNECWEWEGSRTNRGYGQARRSSAHRSMWEMVHGPIPDGLFVCHRCDNPPCIRPSHLYLGTAQDNNQDTVRRGRRRPARRLGMAEAVEIRERRAHGETVEALAAEFRISVKAVLGIEHDLLYPTI